MLRGSFAVLLYCLGLFDTRLAYWKFLTIICGEQQCPKSQLTGFAA